MTDVPKRKRAPGGGRKPIAPGGCIKRTITMPKPDWAKVERLGHGNASDGIRLAVRRARLLKREQKPKEGEATPEAPTDTPAEVRPIETTEEDSGEWV